MSAGVLTDRSLNPNMSSNVHKLLHEIGGTISYLNHHCQSRTFAEIAGCLEKADHLEERYNSLRAERPDLIRVLVMGEFKAGKSTLINALLGRPVAATDVFEMTTVVCRIIPVTEHEECVVLTAPNTELPAKSMSLTDFLDYSVQQAQALRGTEQSQRFEYTQADLYVNTDLSLEILDTPGLGATLENELNALDAINTCDVILWAINAQNIGGARESALLENIQQRDQPFLCVVTKIDALSSVEVDTITDYVLDDYEIPEDQLFLVSAKQVLEGQSDLGVEKLRMHLQTKIAPVGAQLREKALLAQAKDVGVEAGLALYRVDQSLAEAITRNEEIRESFLATASVITNDVALELSSTIRHELKANITSILGRTPERGNDASHVQLPGDQDMARAVETAIRNIDMKAIAGRLNLAERYESLWIDGLQSEISMMVSGLASVEQEANQEAARIAERITRGKIDQAENKKQSLKSVLEAMESIVNESTSIFHFGFALITNIPTLIKRYVASLSHGGTGTSTSSVKQVFSEWVDETVDNLVEKDFTANFRARNCRVAMEAADKFARDQDNWPASLDELGMIRNQCRATYSHLSELVLLDDLPSLTSAVTDSAPSSAATKGSESATAVQDNDDSHEGTVLKLKDRLENLFINNKEIKQDDIKIAMNSVDRLIGLRSVKSSLSELCDFVSVQKLRQQMRQEQGYQDSSLNLHTVFTGNPGTGKTSVARLLGQIYHAMGILSKGHVVEVGRSDLIAAYVGQTAKLVTEVVNRSLGGILFVDEAYALIQGGGGHHDYGQEAIDTLLALMENHREEFVVIAAGYPKPMKLFIASNPGLESRFTQIIHFDDYTADELTTIFENLATEDGYRLSYATRKRVLDLFEVLYAAGETQAGNGRMARNLLEATRKLHSTRVKELPKTASVLNTLEPQDIPERSF